MNGDPEQLKRVVGGASARETGIALSGENIFSVADGETVEAYDEDDDQTVIHYHFPVEIEVRASADAVDQEDIIAKVLTRLERGLESL